MAKIRSTILLKHQANLEDELHEVELAEGEEITVLKEWADRYLCKSAAGRLFNIPKQYVDPQEGDG